MDWIKKQLFQLLGPKYIRSLSRGLLKALAGILIGLEIDPQHIESFQLASEPVLTALFLYAIAQGWSWADKKKNQPEEK